MSVDIIAMILVVAVLVEAVVEVIKGWVPEEAKVPAWLWPVVSAALGVAVCIAASVDVFGLLGVKLAVPYLGAVLTGVLISRGASFVHDVWARINDSSLPEINTIINGLEVEEVTDLTEVKEE